MIEHKGRYRPLKQHCVVLCAFAAVVLGGASAQGQGAGASAIAAPAGIMLDSPWRQKVYAYALEKLLHPAWGWRHSERDYLLATAIAKKDGLVLDDDVLFAAAFLHDIGAIDPFAKEGVDHAERSVELAQPILERSGFPMGKFGQVRAAILGHMYDKEPGKSAEAITLHDADTLDFLGATGVTRRLSVTGNAVDVAPGIARAELFSKELPGRLLTRTGRKMGRERVKVMTDFLRQLKRETPAGASI